MGHRDKKRHPGWLQPRWERQKRDTAARVEAAITALQKDHAEVTYASICKRVSILFGLSISPNTIKRNELSYRIYMASRRPPRRKQLRESVLMQLIKWEFPRLCRGGTRSLTDPGVHPRNSWREPRSPRKGVRDGRDGKPKPYQVG